MEPGGLGAQAYKLSNSACILKLLFSSNLYTATKMKLREGQNLVL